MAVEQTAIDAVIAELTQLRKDRPGLVQRIDKMITQLGGTTPANGQPAAAQAIPPGAAGH